jgi:hypothetical protein
MNRGLGVVLMVSALLGCGSRHDSVTPVSSLRVLHASPDAPAVDVALDGEVVLSGVPFEGGSGFLTVASGSTRIEVRPTKTTTDVIDATVDLAMGGHYTAIAIGPVASIAPLLLAEDLTPPRKGDAKVRVVHASVAAGPVDV